MLYNYKHSFKQKSFNLDSCKAYFKHNIIAWHLCT